MEAIKPNLAAVKRLLNTFIGKKVWGVKLSVAWLSIELGSSWLDTTEQIERGEGTLFISCLWKLKVPGKRPITSEMKRTQKWCRSTEALLEGRTLIDCSLSASTHELVLSFQGGMKLCVAPQGGKDSLDEWTLFFRSSKNQREIITFNGCSISHEE